MACWDEGWGAVVLWPPLAAAGLYFSTVLRLAIADMVAEFSYRERFGAFLLHLVVPCAPWMFLGLPGLAHALGALGVLIAFHAATPSHFGRLLACSGALVLSAYAGANQPPAGLAPVWALLALLAVRTLHVRFVLEAEGDPHGPDTRHELRQLLPAVGAPMLAALLVFATTAALLEPRALSFQSTGMQETAHPIGPVAVASPFLDAAIIVVLVVALLAMLNYLQSQLRKLNQGSGEDPLPLGGRTAVLAEDAADDGSLSEEAATGDRERILKAFRRLTKGLATAVPRAGHETPAEYALRLARLSERAELAAVQSRTFDGACYSPGEPSRQEADEYEGYVATELDIVRERAKPPSPRTQA